MRRLVLLVLFLLVAGSVCAQERPLAIQGTPANTPEGSHIFAGTVFSGVSISWQVAVTARYLMVFDATALPANGTITAATGLAYCLYLPETLSAPNRFTLDWTTHPALMQHGVVVALSTGAGCGTLTVDGSNDYFYSQVR